LLVTVSPLTFSNHKQPPPPRHIFASTVLRHRFCLRPPHVANHNSFSPLPRRSYLFPSGRSFPIGCENGPCVTGFPSASLVSPFFFPTTTLVKKFSPPLKDPGATTFFRQPWFGVETCVSFLFFSLEPVLFCPPSFNLHLALGVPTCVKYALPSVPYSSPTLHLRLAIGSAHPPPGDWFEALRTTLFFHFRVLFSRRKLH